MTLGRLGATCLFASLTACGQAGNSPLPGDSSDHKPFAAIAESEKLHFIGTEPFWRGDAADGKLTYASIADEAGITFPVTRFAGRGGLSLSGSLNGADFDMMVTPGDCSDGMSDRTYPYVVTIRVDGETREGCGWSESKGFIGQKSP